MEIAGKTIVITGASRGIGRALAINLGKYGCNLVLTALEKDELESLADDLSSKYEVPVEALPADLVDSTGRKNLLEWLRSLKTVPDILVNNAGGGRFGRFDASLREDIERTLILNIHASVMLTRELLPLLKTRPESVIVNISSGIARQPYPGLAVYGAAKGFISSFSESLACELAGSNVRVLCFHPGFTETNFMSSAGMDMSRVPKFLVSSPEATAAGIIRSMRMDKEWAYSDLSTRVGILAAAVMPRKMRNRVMRNFFWRLPDED